MHSRVEHCRDAQPRLIQLSQASGEVAQLRRYLTRTHPRPVPLQPGPQPPVTSATYARSTVRDWPRPTRIEPARRSAQLSPTIFRIQPKPARWRYRGQTVRDLATGPQSGEVCDHTGVRHQALGVGDGSASLASRRWSCRLGVLQWEIAAVEQVLEVGRRPGWVPGVER